MSMERSEFCGAEFHGTAAGLWTRYTREFLWTTMHLAYSSLEKYLKRVSPLVILARRNGNPLEGMFFFGDRAKSAKESWFFLKRKKKVASFCDSCGSERYLNLFYRLSKNNEYYEYVLFEDILLIFGRRE